MPVVRVAAFIFETGCTKHDDMDANLNSFADVPEQHADNDVSRETAIDSTCRWGCRNDIEFVVHRFDFVTLSFDRPQTVFRLPQWRWPRIGPYNGFSGAARIRGWQLLRFYQANGWLTYSDVCSVTGAVGDMQLHNEDYVQPWDAFPVSRRAHLMIHTRHRFPKAWGEILANEAIPGTWAKTLSCTDTHAAASNDCSAAQMLTLALHPAWVVVPVREFESR